MGCNKIQGVLYCRGLVSLNSRFDNVQLNIAENKSIGSLANFHCQRLTAININHKCIKLSIGMAF